MAAVNSHGSTKLPQAEVTVIALCFNHERFAAECLDSIRSQTLQNFQLIIVDDHSTDSSPRLIQKWINDHEIDCIFIKNSQNIGVCKSLNEALRQASGKYICMIATDDVWHSNRIEHHISYFQSVSEDVALVFSDVDQIDENGRALPKTFLETQIATRLAPSGRVLSSLLDRNFVHPLAATIRRSAIEHVGGYDEQQVVEDYDMWLRLADQFLFSFVPGEIASYRIVQTSITRTLFSTPNASYAFGKFRLCEIWLSSDRLTRIQRERWGNMQWESAYWLFRLQDHRAKHCLWKSLLRRPTFRTLLLAAASTFGIRRSTMVRLGSLFNGRWSS